MKKYYVIGNKASTSLSPIIFNYWFNKYRIDAKYGYLEWKNRRFDKLIEKTLLDKNIFGLNITIPFKQKIMKHLHDADNHSKNINAVNCVSIKKKIKGFNTDWSGYYKTLPKKIKISKNSKILLIGYGGAALAIHYVLITKGFKNITVVNRSRKKIKFVKKTIFTKNDNNIGEHLKKADLIINTTPKNPIKKEYKTFVDKKTYLSDIVYNPKETSFLKQFPENKKIYGIYMLLEQAILCFEIWFGFKPLIDKKLIRILEKKIK